MNLAKNIHHSEGAIIYVCDKLNLKFEKKIIYKIDDN
jgi:hypothetical protein